MKFPVLAPGFASMFSHKPGDKSYHGFKNFGEVLRHELNNPLTGSGPTTLPRKLSADLLCGAVGAEEGEDAPAEFR